MRRLLFLVSLAACQDGSPHLSTTEQLAVIVNPATYTFPMTEVGKTSAATTISVNPSFGNQYDTITQITEACPDFSVNAPGLPADVYRVCEYTNPCYPQICAQAAPCTTTDYQTYQFSAQFRPTVAGSVSCVVTVHLSDGTTKTTSLSGTGTVPPIDIDVQPTSVAFGDVRRNTASTGVSLAVRNAGGQTASVSGASISSGFSIASGPTGAYGLGAGASMAYSLTCNPTAVGGMNGSFVVTSNDPATPTITVPLSCNGIDSNLALSPSPTTIAPTRVGEPTMAAITIANSGAATMQLEGVSLSGGDLAIVGATPPPGTYGTGAIGTVTVSFAAATKGTYTGSLDVTYDGGQVRSVPINARALATSLALTPDGDVDFGPVCAGQQKSQVFTVIANEEGSFTVTGLGGVAAPFSVTAPTLPASVAGSGASMLTFEVAAAPAEAGIQTSALELATNIPDAPPRMINLSVDALPGGVSPSPAMVDFGSTVTDTTTIGQSVHLSNCDTMPVTFSSARIEGPDASEFAIVATPTSTTIPANGLASWLVVMTVNSVGLKHAELVVDHDGGTARIALDGEGLGETPADVPELPTDELSYYGCATASSTGWPLVLIAFVFVCRRRRAISR